MSGFRLLVVNLADQSVAYATHLFVDWTYAVFRLSKLVKYLAYFKCKASLPDQNDRLINVYLDYPTLCQ